MIRQVKPLLLLEVIGFACLILVSCNSSQGVKSPPDMEDDNKPQVSAELLLLSEDGKDPYGETITSTNIKEFLPSKEDIAFLKSYFEEQQLQFTYYSGISATLVGSPQQFETLFGIKLSEDDGQYSLASTPEDSDDPTIIPKDSLPKEVQDKISVITLPTKPDLFR